MFVILCKQPHFSFNIIRLLCDILCLFPGMENLCSSGWTKFGNFCYFINNQSKTWQDAREYCHKQNAYLVDIHTADENAFVSKLSSTKAFWIGYYASQGDFVWDRTGVRGSYLHWRNNKPDRERHPCVIMNLKYEFTFGQWSDRKCNTALASACKKGNQSGRKDLEN